MNAIPKKKTFIAIDDEANVLEDTASVLRAVPGAELLATFTSASEALDYLRLHGPVDVVLCDIRMPGISGLEAAALLVNHCRLFALLTGHAQHTQEAYARGADAYILKPLEPTDAERLIEKLRRHGQATPAPFRLAFDRLFVYDGDEKLYRPVDIAAITKALLGGNYVYVYAPGLVSAAKMTMGRAVELLAPSGLFIRVNPGTLIGKRHITRVGNHVAYLGSESFKVSKQFQPAFRTFVRDHQFGKGNAFS